MIAVLINTQADTDVMTCILDRLEENPDNIVMVNPTRTELESILEEYPNETCLFLGHGSPNGLFRAAGDIDFEPAEDDWYEQGRQLNLWDEEDEFMDVDMYYSGVYRPSRSMFIIDAENVHLLRDREVIGIWCYASEFAAKYHLRGFFTYMFVSNPTEANCLGFQGHTTEEVNEQNVSFCNQINNLIREGVEPQDFIENLHYDDTIDFVHYNYSRMVYNYGY